MSGWCIDFIKQRQDQAIFWYIGHGSGVMLVANQTLLVDQQQSRDASQLEYIPLLPIQVRNLVPGIGQANKRQVFACPIAFECGAIFRTDGDNNRVTRGKSLNLIAQLRKMSAAVGSDKTTQEDQDDIFLCAVIRQSDRVV